MSVLTDCCDTMRRFTKEKIGRDDFTIQETWELYNLTKDEQDLNLLLTNCLGMITGLIAKYPYTEADELFSLAMEGFMRAVRTYDPDRQGTKFHTYMMSILVHMYWSYFNRKDIRERMEYESSLDAIVEDDPTAQFVGDKGLTYRLDCLPDNLSDRHREFARLAASGYSDHSSDIARKMGITMSEAKKIRYDLRRILTREGIVAWVRKA